MQIGELSRITGVKVDTLRFYAKQGLLSYTHTQRYWNFEKDQIELVSFIILLRSLNFSISEISYLFNADENLLDGNRIIQESVKAYRSFLEEKMLKLSQQREVILKAEDRMDMMLTKIVSLEDKEIFNL